jgi:iron complex outermembrane receptor protein
MIMQPVYNGMIPRKVEDIWKNADLANYGFFAEYKAAFGTWNIFAGLRLDYNMASSDPVLLYGAVPPGTPPPLILDIQNTSSSHFNVSGSLGASKKLGKFFELDLAVGRGVRSPNMVERFIILLPVSFDNYEYYGNPQLKPEVNYEGDLTFKFLHPKAGDFGLTGFYSYVQDFINGKLVPSSVQKPLSQSVLGVKQFINYDQAWFTGFEFSWALSATYKLGAAVTAAYTYGVYPKATKYVLDPTKIPSQQIVGEEEVKNDAIPEIPPFEANFRLSYRFLKDKLIPRISYRMVLSQNHVSSAYYESKTPGFNIFGASLTYRPNKYISVVGGVNNIFNVDYYEHLNRRTQGTLINLYEPGRVFFVNLTFNI